MTLAGAWAPLLSGQLLSGPAPRTRLQKKVKGTEAHGPTKSTGLRRPKTILMDSKPPARGQAADGETEALGDQNLQGHITEKVWESRCCGLQVLPFEVVPPGPG